MPPRAGHVRALPNLPTLTEAGVKAFDYEPWYCLFAPRDPQAIVGKPHDEVNKVLGEPTAWRNSASRASRCMRCLASSRGHRVSGDIVKWAQTIKKLGLRGER